MLIHPLNHPSWCCHYPQCCSHWQRWSFPQHGCECLMITIGQNVLSQETGYTRKALHYSHISIFEAFRENCDSYECWLWQSFRHWILMLFVIINFTASMFHKYLVCFSLPFLQLYWTDFLLHGSYWTQVWSYPALVKPLLITLSFA